jgi:hypothetical protein
VTGEIPKGSAEIVHNWRGIQSRAQSGARVYVEILPLLHQKTRVPLRLPTYFGTEDGITIFATVSASTPSRYVVALDLLRDCHQATVCRLGEVSGEVRGPRASRLRGTRLKLDHELVGYFVDVTCGASCGDSVLSWDEGRYRYSVGIKAEKVAQLRKVANSAIANRLVSKR